MHAGFFATCSETGPQNGHLLARIAAQVAFAHLRDDAIPKRRGPTGSPRCVLRQSRVFARGPQNASAIPCGSQADRGMNQPAQSFAGAETSGVTQKSVPRNIGVLTHARDDFIGR